MAAAIVSSLVDKLASFLVDQAAQKGIQEVSRWLSVEEDVRKLNSNLYAILGVLEDAERKQLKDAFVKQWLYKLKEVSYDIDDVLDEWNTAILKRQIEEGENAPGEKRKVWSINPFDLFNFCSGQVAGHRDIINKIKELNERLDVIANEKHNFNFTSMRGAEELERQITASVIDPSEVHGREHDKNTIVGMLRESSQGSTLRIISIVGMGGIGKTTLAQLVYNDETVKAYFQERIWVCVSDPFDEIRIAKAILEALTKKAPDLNELDSLLRSLCHLIEGKKFLLVLDDVWTEDHRRFEQLKNSLKRGSPGSIILVTTRKETVAKTIGTIDTDMFSLGQLSNEECWSLFSRVALFGRSNEQCENLKDIGLGIVNKCKGLPLAAKFLGSLLLFKNTRKEWRDVLDSEVWKLEEAGSGLFPPLLLSYYDLSPTLRQCFSYCAIFPKDHKMSKDGLIKSWMAQGYLRATSSKDMETVGEECFKNLAMRSFFQDFENEGAIFKMHDIVHDFAQFLTEDECVVMDVNGPEELRLDSSRVKARHSMLMLGENHLNLSSIKNLKNLRSLIVECKGFPMTSVVLSEVFDQLTCLRTLNLSSSSLTELPKEVGKLIHLRYLNLAYNNKLKELPEEVCDLCNLQSLNVFGCRALKKLPHGLGKLINLRHLEILWTSISFMPKGVERLTSLRRIDDLYVSSDVNNSEVSTLKDLKNLNHLRGNLRIYGLRKLSYVDEIEKAQLENMKHLIGLELHFKWEEAEENDEQVIEAIQPPPNLEELRIYYYKGTVLPNWMMSLTNLKKIHMGCIRNCELLPPLGKLSSLESLFMFGIDNVKKVGIEFLGIETSSSSSVIVFPQLKELHLWDMHNWEEWDYGITRRTGEEEDITTATTIIIMPRLRSLDIRGCPKLKALPDHVLHSTSLEKLKIDDCPILEDRYYKKREGEDWPKISHIPNIKIDYKYVKKHGKDFADNTELFDSDGEESSLSSSDDEEPSMSLSDAEEPCLSSPDAEEAEEPSLSSP